MSGEPLPKVTVEPLQATLLLITLCVDVAKLLVVDDRVHLRVEPREHVQRGLGLDHRHARDLRQQVMGEIADGTRLKHIKLLVVDDTAKGL